MIVWIWGIPSSPFAMSCWASSEMEAFGMRSNVAWIASYR